MGVQTSKRGGGATRDTWGTYIQARGEGEEGYRGWWVVCGSAEELVRREREGKALPFGAAHEGTDLRTTAWEPCEEGDHKTTGRTVTEPQNTSQHTVVLSDIGREGIHMTNEENHCQGQNRFWPDRAGHGGAHLNPSTQGPWAGRSGVRGQFWLQGEFGYTVSHKRKWS
jgi:hypothetical protein